MDAHATLVVNCMLLALKTYPFKIYINDSSGVSAFNPIAELNLTNSPARAELPTAFGSSPTSARSVFCSVCSFFALVRTIYTLRILVSGIMYSLSHFIPDPEQGDLEQEQDPPSLFFSFLLFFLVK